MYIEFADDEIAILYDALYHVESTTDVYRNPYNEESVEEYKQSFINTFEKVESLSHKGNKRGVLYFQ